MSKSKTNEEKITDKLKREYDKICKKKYGGNYLEILKNFQEISEERLKRMTKSQGSWNSSKGTLYEYAVFKFIEQILKEDPSLSELSVYLGKEAPEQIKSQLLIGDKICPDADILIVKDKRVKAIVSCKTSLRERLTETAFWKREFEMHNQGDDKPKFVLITTEKDKELRQASNTYIIEKVLDRTFITDPNKYEDLITNYRKRYGPAKVEILKSKVKPIDELKDFLKELSQQPRDGERDRVFIFLSLNKIL